MPQHEYPRWRGGKRKGSAHARLALPVGKADAAPLFDKQPNEPGSAIELLTIAEAAGFLRISKSSVRRLQQGRHIPFFKVGGSIRFARDDLASYLVRQRVGSIGA
jgi:excisionase family DNA binding protein